MIYITGDTHGEYDRFLEDETIKGLDKDDYLIICGDFGFVNSEEGTITGSVEEKILDEMGKMPYTILFVDGVHDNFRRLNTFPVELWNGGKTHRIRSNIFHLMRGQVYEIMGKKFFAMGGALSDHVFDLDKREGEIDINCDSLPTRLELEEGWNNLQKCAFNVDYILTYSPTAKAITSQWHTIMNPNGGAILPFLEDLTTRVQYKSWYFGMLHMDMHRGNEQSPLAKYCQEKKMNPVWLKVIPLDD